MLGLRTTIYRVTDLAAAKSWYAQAFEKPPYFDEPYYVGFNIGGYELGLLPSEMDPGSKTANVLSYWGVLDVEAAYQRLLHLGAKELEPPENVGGPLVVATVLDPWGNAIGLIFNPDFKAEA